MKLSPEDGFKGVKDTSLATVFAIDSNHKIGACVGYNFANGKICHDVKFARDANNMHLSLGVKNGDALAMCMNTSLPENRRKLAIGSLYFNCNKLHLRTDYGMKSADWGAKLCCEGDAGLGDFGTKSTKFQYDLKTGDYSESNKIKINNSCEAIVGAKSNISGFF